jgi:hypothetical protein
MTMNFVNHVRRIYFLDGDKSVEQFDVLNNKFRCLFFKNLENLSLIFFLNSFH